MLSVLDLQIISTLSYSDQFVDPLTISDIEKRLVNKDLLPFIPKTKDSNETIKSRTKYLENQGVLINRDGYYFLRNKRQIKNQHQELDKMITLKQARHQNSIKIRSSIKKLLSFCIKISWIKAIGITGSVAVNSASSNDDLDLIVVTADNRLWISRFILLIFSLIIGKKVIYWKRNLLNGIKDEWCFNLWMEEGTLSIPVPKQNYYSAFESLQIDWIYDVDSIEQKYYEQNSWIASYFKLQPWIESISFAQKNQKAKNNLVLMTILNQLAYILDSRHLYKKNNIPKTNLGLHQASMHDNSSFCQYLDNWVKKYQDIVRKA